MDYEKKYKEALKWARKVMQGKVGFVLDEVLEKFPELKESEDERIRKEILQFIRMEVEDEIVGDKWIAWLEKQKEFVSADFDDVWETADCNELTAPLEKYSKDAIKEMCHAWYDKGIELERRNWLEKQGEQKPAENNSEWNVSDFRTWQYIVSDVLTKKDGIGQYLDNGECKKIAKYMQEEWSGKLGKEQTQEELLKCEDYGIDGLYHAIRILEDTLGKVDGYQTDDGILEHKCAINAVKELYEQEPAEWSEEDKKKLDRIYSILGIAADEHAYSSTCRLIGDKEAVELQDFLRSIAKPQPQPEWSDYDEAILLELSQCCDMNKTQVQWLLALKNRMQPQPQNHWKPSDLQIKALEYYIKIGCVDKEGIFGSELVKLLEELKKL